jgi:hypothetical protein
VPLLPAPPSRKRSVPNFVTRGGASVTRQTPSGAQARVPHLCTSRTACAIVAQRASGWGVRGGAALPPLPRGLLADASGAERAKRVEAERGVQGHPDTQTQNISCAPLVGALGSRKRPGQCARSRTSRPALRRPGLATTAGPERVRRSPRPRSTAPWVRKDASAEARVPVPRATTPGASARPTRERALRLRRARALTSGTPNASARRLHARLRVKVTSGRRRAAAAPSCRWARGTTTGRRT